MLTMNCDKSGLTKPAQRGFTLVEVLVSMVVVAVGILAVLGVQSRTLVDTQTAVRRAQAVRLIDDLSERMRSNPSGLAQINNYVSDFSEQPDPDDEPSPDCVGGSCTSSELAQYDTTEWKKAIARSLPNGQARIFEVAGEVSAVGGRRQLGVMVAWRENERDTGNADHNAELIDPLQMKNISDNSGIKDSAGADVQCPDDHICHLQYVQLTSRCTTDELAGSVFYCADGLYLIN